MAYIKCGTNGGTLSETVLWTNSSPTSSFEGQTVTLSDDIDNYTYLKFTFIPTTSNTTDEISIIYSVDDFKKLANNSSDPFFRGISPYAFSQSVACERAFFYISNTSVSFAYGSTGTVTHNEALIPVSVSGLK